MGQQQGKWQGKVEHLEHEVAKRDAENRAKLIALHELEAAKRAAVEKLEKEVNAQKSKLRREYDIDESKYSPYDLVLESTTFSDLLVEGWKVDIKEQNLRLWFLANAPNWNVQPESNRVRSTSFAGHRPGSQLLESEARGLNPRRASAAPPTAEWDCTIIAIIGFYDRGKTWLLNKLTASQFRSSKRYATQGLSFSIVKSTDSLPWVILDTAGFGSPVAFRGERKEEFVPKEELTKSEEKEKEKKEKEEKEIVIPKKEDRTRKEQRTLAYANAQAMEHYLRDLTLNTAQLLLFVVNDLTVADQKFIDYLEGKAGSGSLIVVHNFKEVTTKEELDEVWKRQVANSFHGRVENVNVLAHNPVTGQAEERKVTFFRGLNTRHVVLVDDHSEFGGEQHNPWNIKFLQILLAGAAKADDPVCIPEVILKNTENWGKRYLKNFKGVEYAVKDGVVHMKAVAEDAQKSVELKEWSVDDATNNIIFSKQIQESQMIPHCIYVTQEKNTVDEVTKNWYWIVLHIPGVSRQDLTVNLNQGVLHVTANVPSGIKDFMDDDYLLIEEDKPKPCQSGELTFEYKLPQGADSNTENWKWWPKEGDRGLLRVGIPVPTKTVINVPEALVPVNKRLCVRLNTETDFQLIVIQPAVDTIDKLVEEFWKQTFHESPDQKACKIIKVMVLCKDEEMRLFNPATLMTDDKLVFYQ